LPHRALPNKLNDSLRFPSGDGGIMALLQVGALAPDFELPAVTGERKHHVKLSDYRGKQHVVLAFFPAAWTPT
jgi:hypothetical protein